MKILNELVDTVVEAEVIQNEDRTFSLKMTPKLYEDLFTIQAKVDSMERILTTMRNDSAEKHSDTLVGKMVVEYSDALLKLIE